MQLLTMLLKRYLYVTAGASHWSTWGAWWTPSMQLLTICHPYVSQMLSMCYCRGIALEQLGRVVDAKEVLLVGLALDPDGPHHMDLQDAIYRCGALQQAAVHVVMGVAAR
jgi:hypothetical protein